MVANIRLPGRGGALPFARRALELGNTGIGGIRANVHTLSCIRVSQLVLVLSRSCRRHLPPVLSGGISLRQGCYSLRLRAHASVVACVTMRKGAPPLIDRPLGRGRTEVRFMHMCVCSPESVCCLGVCGVLLVLRLTERLFQNLVSFAMVQC